MFQLCLRFLAVSHIFRNRRLPMVLSALFPSLIFPLPPANTLAPPSRFFSFVCFVLHPLPGNGHFFPFFSAVFGVLFRSSLRLFALCDGGRRSFLLHRPPHLWIWYELQRTLAFEDVLSRPLLVGEGFLLRHVFFFDLSSHGASCDDPQFFRLPEAFIFLGLSDVRNRASFRLRCSTRAPRR